MRSGSFNIYEGSEKAGVAIGGLMASTFLTLVYVPILYSLFDELKEKAKSFSKRIRLIISVNNLLLMELPMPSLRFLFLKFFQVGATAYGGPGMIMQIKEAAVKRYGWVTEGMFIRGVALCQLIPGATMV